MTLKRFGILAARLHNRVKREDRRAGELIAMFYNANRDIEKDPTGIQWDDVFPEWKEAAPEQSDEQMMRAMEMWVGARQQSAQA